VFRNSAHLPKHNIAIALARPSLIFLSTIWLTGCVPYPVYKTIQPSSQMTVLNERGEPIEGAKVVLMAGANPYGFERSRETKTTNRQGIAAFEERSEWRTESLMMHGAEFFFWNWCVQKPGFKTYLTRFISDEKFDRQPTVQLSGGAPSECPEAPR
jgi:hypothetical protein